MNRISKDDYYLAIAAAVALRSPCLKKHYGAVIVKDDQILSTGYNGPARGEPHCVKCTKVCSAKDESAYSSCASVHAEMNSLLNVARKDMLGGTLYLACLDKDGNTIPAYPCDICLRLIKNSGISNVINSDGLIYTRDESGILVSCK